MAFNYKGTINGAQRNLLPVLINDSITVAVGEVVESYTNGVLANGLAATPLLGVIHSIVRKDTLPEIKGEHTAGSTNTSDVRSVTTAADNVSTEKYWAMIDTSVNSLYSALVSGTLGTTVSSTLRGCRADVDSSNTNYARILETTATRTVATTANFYSWGLDPEDSTRLIVSIANSELVSNPSTEA